MLYELLENTGSLHFSLLSMSAPAELYTLYIFVLEAVCRAIISNSIKYDTENISLYNTIFLVRRTESSGLHNKSMGVPRVRVVYYRVICWLPYGAC